MCGEEDDIKGRHEVVDALHVTACGVPDGPYVQYSLHRPLHLEKETKIELHLQAGSHRQNLTPF